MAIKKENRSRALFQNHHRISFSYSILESPMEKVLKPETTTTHVYSLKGMGCLRAYIRPVRITRRLREV